MNIPTEKFKLTTMEKERVLIAMDGETFKDVLNEFFVQANKPDILSEFESDRLSKVQAAKFAGISLPTLDRRVLDGTFTEYKLGRRVYFSKSEMIASMRINFK